MKAIDLDEIRIKKGVSIYDVIKSLCNENNFSDEDWEYELPRRTKRYYFRDYKKH